MSYFILKTTDFAKSTESKQRVLHILKKKHVPYGEQMDILRLKCSSIQRVSRISDLLFYLSSNTADSHHEVKPYMINKISWKDAVDLFGLDSDTDSTDSA